MKTSNIWRPGAQSPQHKTVKSMEVRKEVTTYQSAEPDFDALQPGESVSFSRDVREPEEKWTHDDKVTFQNGVAGYTGSGPTDPSGTLSQRLGLVSGWRTVVFEL